MEAYEKYVGAVLDGRYKIDRIIGVGGMAVVFRAFDMLLERVVAVKMLKNEIAGDEESVKRFVNESKAVSMMSHPNIVSIYDVSVREDIKYIVMEYVEGITLKNYMNKRGVLPLRELISYTEQILRALQHAHGKGIVHRDIKPQNIMLLKNGLIKVTDFGIAKLPNAETVTMTDKAIGTVYYISPEQASGQEIDARSDIYSLGVLMYEMACGQLPFVADSPVSVAMMQINDTAKAPGEIVPSMPKGLEQIIGIAMEKNPVDRYQSAEAMLKQLQKLKENPNIIFKIPKRKPSEEEDGSLLSMLFGNSPMFPVIAGVALSFMIIFVIGAVYVFNRMMTATEQTSETITVPTFTGIMYTTELDAWFSASDVYKATIEYSYNSEHAAGVILAQDPPPASKRKVIAGEQFCDIVLTVSKASEEVNVPDLSGVDSREAKLKLKACELFMTVEYIESDIISSGQVVKTAPEAGARIKTGETVCVYISSGSAAGTIEIPDFKGMTEKQAFLKLLELDLMPGKITYVKDQSAVGTVLSQTAPKGDKVTAKTKIDMTVSGGPKYDPDAEDPFKGKEEETTAPETKPPETTEEPEDSTEPESGTDSTDSEKDTGTDTTAESSTNTEPTAPVDENNNNGKKKSVDTTDKAA